jgi:chemotaxis protein MotB
MAEFASQIRLEITPDGLLIQIIDDQKRPMFDSGSAGVKPYMRDILREIGVALLDVDNKISLDGHTDRSSYGNAARGYSNWELSADRANATRRELAAAGMPEDKLARVVGMASSLLLVPDEPLSPTNRRISILVMTKEAEDRLLASNRIPIELELEVETPAEGTGAKSRP